MRLVGVISAAVLSLSLGAAAPAYAQEQHDQQEEQKAKPDRQDERKPQQDKPAKEEKKTAQQDKNSKKEESSTQQQDKNNKHEETNAQQQQKRMEQAKPGQQAQSADGDEARRIPDDRFRANFGREHKFRVSQADYSKDRRFQYGGYWFGFIDPWPNNWLYTQDVFVVDIDGAYYLCNPMYPDIEIALTVTL